MSDAISKLFHFNEMTSPQGIQLTFGEPQEGCFTAGEIMKAAHRFNHIFQNVTAFCLSKSTLLHCYEECSEALTAPFILYVIALLVLVWFYLTGVSSQRLRNNSQQIPAQLHSGLDKKSGNYSVEKFGFFFHRKQHVVYPVTYLCKALFEYYRRHPTKPFNSCDSQ